MKDFGELKAVEFLALLQEQGVRDLRLGRAAGGWCITLGRKEGSSCGAGPFTTAGGTLEHALVLLGKAEG